MTFESVPRIGTSGIFRNLYSRCTVKIEKLICIYLSDDGGKLANDKSDLYVQTNDYTHFECVF